jgi:glyoxylate/hydroxypyruvate reductase A
MTIIVLFAALYERFEQYQAPLTKAFNDRGLSVHLAIDLDPSCVDYIVYAPNSDVQDFTPYTRCKAVLNLWAGVESVVHNITLTQPLARMVDVGLTDGMVEWVTGHVLRHHLGMDAHIHGQDGLWRSDVPPLAKDRIVTVLGLGELGSACAKMLCRFGFQVRGWSKSEKTIEGIDCFACATGLHDALKGAQIVVLLLPNTPETEDTLNAKTIAGLARGAFVINPGRGTLINDQDLLNALDSGHVAHATLDVFRVEPLPIDHPFWAHPNVTVVPHKASETRPDTASQVIAENIFRCENGAPLLHIVDRAAGY